MAIPIQVIQVHPTPPASVANASPRSFTLRPTLPDKNIRDSTIEDAYVSFVLYCNPAVPLEVDTTALRESFRTPPKSDGKSFSTFTLYELIRQLETKEIKTWAELALKLGVTPPDQDKGQSSQKIQQYAVRLKRWMHSMHVDAFFEYCLGNSHPYFTQIPSDPNPVCENGRDGVAAEDDMALRALLPQIKPRRGRRKHEAEDDGMNRSPPAQRPRLDSPAFHTEMRQARQLGLEPWTAHPDGRNAFVFPPTDQTRSSVLPGSDPAFSWQPSDVSRTPLTTYPQSAITPVSRQAMWPDPTEPRSAITPTKINKLLSKRHGAKVVSSAWRSRGSAAANGKMRGRPPINRPNNDGSLSAYPMEPSQGLQTVEEQIVPHESPAQSAGGITPVFSTQQSGSTAMPSQPTSASTPPQPSRPTKRGRLSLQVPQRVGGSVRLATPPAPAVIVNGEIAANDESTVQTFHSNGMNGAQGGTTTSQAPSSLDFYNRYAESQATSNRTPTLNLANDTDRTNVSEVENLFVSEILTRQWRDVHGAIIPAPGIDEVMALAKTIVNDLAKQALTPGAFLINLTALVGGNLLQRGTKGTIARLEEGDTHNKYLCSWELRYQSLKQSFSLTASVPHVLWKRGVGGGGGGGGGREQESGVEEEETTEESADQPDDDASEEARRWKAKYTELLKTVLANQERSIELRKLVLEGLAESSLV